MLTVPLRAVLNLLLITGASLALEGAANPGCASAQSIPRQGLHDLAEGPPELKPLSKEPINVKMLDDAKTVYETLGKLAGLTVIFDPDFAARRISVELANLTIEQAFD